MIAAMGDLEKDLEIALLDLWQKWKSVPYNQRFRQMVVRTNNIRVYKGPVGPYATCCAEVSLDRDSRLS